MYYNWHRYYDPDTGRYLTPDPIGLAGGINPFVYASNDPVNNIDPYGENSIAIGGYTGFAIGGPVGAAIGIGIGAIAGYMIYDWLTDDDDYWPDDGGITACPAYEARKGGKTGKGERGYTGSGDRNINPDKKKKFNPKTGKWEKKDPHSGKWKPTTPPQ